MKWIDGDALLRSGKIGERVEQRILKRSCESLLGLCEGIMIDGDLSNDKIYFLGQWLEEHQELATAWPGEVLFTKINEVLADGVITAKERTHLKETLRQLIGSRFEETGAIGGLATTLPVESVDKVRFTNHFFCFTGTFLFGTRAACERAIEKRGGIPLVRIRRDLDYLVIGTLTTQAWANTSFGRKIEKAVAYKKSGCHVKIISEKDWTQALRADVV